MRKEDIIRLHALLFQMRRSFEAAGDVGSAFAAYDALKVTPVRLDKDRRAHTMAVFLLGEALSKLAVQRYGEAADLRTHLHFIQQPATARL